MGKKDTPTIYVVSDGRGDTCHQLVRAALVQYRDQKCRVVRKAEVRTREAVETIVGQAAADGAVIFYTLVSDDTRETIKAVSESRLVPTVDVLGPSFSALHDLFKSSPQHTPGLLYATDRERLDRIDAIDYTLKHDDGQRPDDLDDADVVLVGVSRAAKSSTCFYLAYAGVRAANVPLLPGIPPLRQLDQIEPEKVIGLRMNVMRLQTVREVRATRMRLKADDPYIEKREIAREVLEANRLMDDRGWRSIDASYMAVEEVAREVMALRGLTGSIHT